jgi:hypothetical protein
LGDEEIDKKGKAPMFVIANTETKEPIMNEAILKELKTLNSLLALIAIEINKQDGKNHIGHSIFTEKLRAAIELSREISELNIED